MTSADGLTSVEVAPDLLAKILSPYQLHCRYLKRASVEYPSEARTVRSVSAKGVAAIRGELSIGESCYRKQSGSFNSVEFNLCYNQLIYQLLAQCIVDARLPVFSAWTLPEYQRRQLPDVLIHDFACTFGARLNPERFEGVVTITQALDKRRFVYIKTSSTFRDPFGGSADGEVSLVIVDSTRSAPRGATHPMK